MNKNDSTYLISPTIPFDNIINSNNQIYFFNNSLNKISELEKDDLDKDELEKINELNELTRLLEDLETIKIINHDLYLLLGEQYQSTNLIKESLEYTNDKIKNNNENLIIINDIKIKNTSNTIAFSTVGAIIIGGISIPFVGLKIGIICGFISLVSGTIYQISNSPKI
jgi:hypothetical protein